MTNYPSVILRLGSHAEKEYFEKLAKSLDGMLFASNLLEITPAATATFVLGMKSKRGGEPIPFYLDPMTYMFGPYIDPKTGRRRTDLEALKSMQSKERGSKEKVKRLKQSYVKVSDVLGTAFANSAKHEKAIDPSTLTPANRDRLCREVIDYQTSRVTDILSSDDFMKRHAANCLPSAVFAPYFYIADEWAEQGIETALDLAKRSTSIDQELPVHAVIVASPAILRSENHRDSIVNGMKKARVAAVWLWFNGFDELEAPQDDLAAFRELVTRLSTNCDVYNRHGGYFSLLLYHDGLKGISHGVGYGERKEVAQVIGAAAPSVRYYLPPIAKRIGVPEIQRCFSDLGITTPHDFFTQVCGCTICRGVIGNDIQRFRAFGEMHRAGPTSTRDSQTPAAAKMCRFHFLINRMKERGEVASLAADQRGEHISSRAEDWRDLVPLEKHLGRPGTDGYLERWSSVFSDK